MNKSLEPLLSGLIPYLTGPVPDALISHATSLLVQSRSRISTLRPEEEPARAYLCAHIACERLKQRLDLPEILPRPPLQKKQYGLLYKQFNQMLPVGGKEQQVESSQPPPPARRGRKPVVKKANPAIAGPAGAGKSKEEDRLVTVIHFICNGNAHADLVATNAVPYLIAGVRLTIPKPAIANKPTGAEIKKSQACIAALYILITSRLSGKEITGKEYTHTRNLLMESLDTYNKSSTIEIGKITSTDVDGALHGIMSEDSAVDWLRTLPAGVGINKVPEPTLQEQLREDQDPPTDDEEYEKQLMVQKTAMADVDAAARTMKRKRTAEERQTGIGRMLQDRVDYTSAKRRRGYIEWKEEILKKVEAIERSAIASH